MATTDDEFNPGASPTGSFRPALVKLTEDIRDSEEQLFAGFDSRRSILLWTQQLCVRTLGELPQDWYLQMARQFRGVPSSNHERALVASLLRSPFRSRDITPAQASEFRRQLSAQTIRPAAHRAFRELRKGAGEYIGDGDEESQHAAGKQRYVAMRPAIDELHQNQRKSLTKLLDGFDDREEILSWGHDLELATHGEIPESFVSRVYGEMSARKMLTGDSGPDARGRELFAAYYVIPHYNRGIRDLAGRAKENPDVEHTPKEVAQI